MNSCQAKAAACTSVAFGAPPGTSLGSTGLIVIAGGAAVWAPAAKATHPANAQTERRPLLAVRIELSP
jgi:hypothetical protein